jgi:hypothetical protein
MLKIMMNYENVELTFEGYAKGAKKDAKGARTAKFAVHSPANAFGISTKHLMFAKTSKVLKTGRVMKVSKLTTRTTDDGYVWINSIQ